VKLLNLGHGNYLAAERVVAIVQAAAAPIRRLREEAQKRNLLVDATHGRKTRSVVVLDTGHVVLCAVQAETLGDRVESVYQETEPA
jgi:hypothetical protein